MSKANTMLDVNYILKKKDNTTKIPAGQYQTQ